MESIKGFLSRLPNQFNEQRPIVKILIGCSSIYLICLCLSLSVAILLPSKPTPVLSPTPAAIEPIDAYIGPSLLIGTDANTPNPEQTLPAIVARPEVTPESAQISPTLIPKSASDRVIQIGPIYKSP